MINLVAHFYQGKQGKLFRLSRTPEKIKGHILYISPLFEEANQTRHMITKVANHAFDLGYQSIVFDHFGTGDSEGELFHCDLTLWQQDIVNQLQEIKRHSDLPITLSVSLSAGLLLCAEILSLVEHVHFWQVELNGARFVRQLKRLALAAGIEKRDRAEHGVVTPEEMIAIAGYEIPSGLLQQLAEQDINGANYAEQQFELNCCWFEWTPVGQKISAVREKQLTQCQQVFAEKIDFRPMEESKFWQATELVNASQLLTHSIEVFDRQLTSRKVSKRQNSEVALQVPQDNSGGHDA